MVEQKSVRLIRKRFLIRATKQAAYVTTVQETLQDQNARNVLKASFLLAWITKTLNAEVNNIMKKILNFKAFSHLNCFRMCV